MCGRPQITNSAAGSGARLRDNARIVPAIGNVRNEGPELIEPLAAA
jgi:hypothetical protein